MRWSSAFIPTLRDDPADVEAASHKLLVRAGFIRQLMAGVYSLLPLAVRVRDKIGRIIKEEIDGIGGQQFLQPSLHPSEIWKKSGRWDVMGQEMFKFQDRKGAEVGLGMTHEEIFITLALELTSYRQLPQIWYQMHTKFRDEPRPKSGLLRVREFTMKDSYSLDIDEAGLDASFDLHHGAYERIFGRMGMEPVAVAASSGVMGGSGSVEFMVRSDSGEDLVVQSPACGYAANVERATSQLEPIEDEQGPSVPERFPTPGVHTIADLVKFDGGAPADRQIKTLVYVFDGAPGLVLMRGDHGLQEQKLQDATGALEVRPANADEVRGLLGADPGSLGAVGLDGVRVVADLALKGRRNMVTGANVDEHHLRGVNVDRDIAVGAWLDLREVLPGEPCPQCGEPLDVFNAIEIGHIFKLGTKYAEALGANVLDQDGKSRTIVMGSYGIGLERNMAAIVETHHDDKGIVWPVAVAPFEVVITVVSMSDEPSVAAAEQLYADLRAKGIDVLLDDRSERPGVKFTDAELIGFPYRLSVGPRGLGNGIVEMTDRSSGETSDVPLDQVADTVATLVVDART